MDLWKGQMIQHFIEFSRVLGIHMIPKLLNFHMEIILPKLLRICISVWYENVWDKGA